MPNAAIVDLRMNAFAPGTVEAYSSEVAFYEQICPDASIGMWPLTVRSQELFAKRPKLETPFRTMTA